MPGARTYEVQINCGRHAEDLLHGQHRLDAARPTPAARAAPSSAQPGAGLRARTARRSYRDTCFVSVRAYADNAIDGSPIAGPFAIDDFTFGGETFDEHARRRLHTRVRAPAARRDRHHRARERQHRRQEPAALLEARRHGRCGAGITCRATHYWVAIARDPNFATRVQAAFTNEPCWAPVAADGRRGHAATTGRSFRRPATPPATRPPRALPRRLHAPAELPARLGAADADLAGRRGRASGPVVFHWTPVPEQVTNYTIEIAQDDSFSTILESATTDATAYAASTTYPVGATVYWRVRANNNDGKGLAWSATSTLRADAAGADDHDRRAVLRRDVPGAHAGRR